MDTKSQVNITVAHSEKHLDEDLLLDMEVQKAGFIHLPDAVVQYPGCDSAESGIQIHSPDMRVQRLLYKSIYRM